MVLQLQLLLQSNPSGAGARSFSCNDPGSLQGPCRVNHPVQAPRTEARARLAQPSVTAQPGSLSNAQGSAGAASGTARRKEKKRLR